MDGHIQIGDLAGQLAGAGLISHVLMLDPDAFSGSAADDATLETATLGALCALVPGQVFRLSPFAYGVEAGGLGPERLAALPGAIAERLFGGPRPGAVELAPLPPALIPTLAPLDGQALILVGELAGAAQAAAGPGLRSVLDAGYAVAAARLTAERLTGLVDQALAGLTERVRATASQPRMDAAAAETLARAAEAAGTRAAEAAARTLASVSETLVAAATQSLAATAVGTLATASADTGREVDRVAARLADTVAETLADRMADAVRAVAGAGAAEAASRSAEDAGDRQALADRLERIETLLAARPPSGSVPEAEALARIEAIATRLAPSAALPSFRQESEGMARMAVGMQDLMHRLDGHAATLEDTIARMQVRHAETERQLPDLDQRLGAVEAALLRLGEAHLNRREGIDAAQFGRGLAPLSARVETLASDMAILRSALDALAARPEPDLAPLGIRIDTLATRPVPQLLELAARIEDLAARPAIDPEPALMALAARIEDLAARPLPDPAAALAEIGAGVAALAGRADPVPVLAGIADEIAALAARPLPDAALAGIAGELAALAARPLPDHAPALEALSAELAALAARPVVDLRPELAAMADRIADRIGALPDPAPAVAALAERIADLAARPLPDARPGIADLAARLEALAAAAAPGLSDALAPVLASLAGLSARPLLAPADLAGLSAQVAAVGTDLAAARTALPGELSEVLVADLVAGLAGPLAALDSSARLEAGFEGLGARVLALAERAPVDLAPLSRRLDRMAEALQTLSTRAAVVVQSLGPERSRLQQTVAALQSVLAHLDAPGGAEPPVLPGSLEDLAADLARHLAPALSAVLPAPGDAQGLAAATDRLEARLAALLDRFDGHLDGGLERRPESGLDTPAAALPEGFDTRLFAEIGNLRLMLGGLRSSLRDIDRTITAGAPGTSPAGGEVIARLDQIAQILAAYLAPPDPLPTALSA